MSWRGLLPLDLQEARVIGQVALAIPAFALLLIAVSQLFLGREWRLVADIRSDQASIVNAAALPLVLIAMICFVRWGPSKAVSPSMIVLGVMGVALTGASNLLSNDTTAGGMVFYAVPVIFGAFVLGTAGATLLLVASLLMMTVNYFVVAHNVHVVQEVVTTSAALVLITMFVCRARGQEITLRRSLEQMAQTDVLTGFCTRQVLDEKLEDLFDKGKSALPVSLLIIDLDFFKTVNDQHGHPVGDAALRHVADIIRSHAQDGDLTVRLGGDELAVLLVGRPPSGAMSLAKRITQEVHETPLPDATGEGIALTVSVGVGSAVSTTGTAADLYLRADDGLYAAKRGGRDCAAYAQGGALGHGATVHHTGKFC